MKFLERLSLEVFSVIILLSSFILCLVLFSWIGLNEVAEVFKYILYTPLATNITLGVLVALILLSIKCIFFPTYKGKEEKSEGILLENESGKLLISIDTIENLVRGVVSGFSSVKAINCKVKLDKQVNNVNIDINLVVLPDTIIKELSANLQSKIKEVIKTTTEIDIKSVNIKVKNIEAQKDKKVEV